ncbi:excinuclease ABC subunit UvrB [Candidatus Roizmanbacteria bacterium]|nr:excinuclease ABC subunit UvrB [Candidatus Roizmanbacteria bacterium]
MFDLKAPFSPTGDQPNAIEKLSFGIQSGLKNQVLLGVTGSGKTFTMASVIRKLNMPALIISHNKTLAGQLYQEMREFFPHNAVSYFVSYYDYYQPEAYIPTTDTYIEKEAQINDLIDKLRLQATTNIVTRKDTVVVASVSCIYNIGSPAEYRRFIVELNVGDPADWKSISTRLVHLLYDRSEFEFKRGSFRVRGNSMDIYPAYEDYGVRVLSDNGRISGFYKFDPLTGKKLEETENSAGKWVIYPAKHNLADPVALNKAEQQIRSDLIKEHTALKNRGRLIEAQRLLQKVNYDLEMLKEVGYVNGIENYSRYFDGRMPGDPPYSLLDYFRMAYGDKFTVFIDESHMTVPQLGGMYNGDAARKKTLIDFGFRLNSAYDNRPLKFDEFYKLPPHIVYVSATPKDWEVDMARQEAKLKKLDDYDGVVEQLIRPTGIVDPIITIKPAQNEISDLISEIEKRVAKGERVLVTTLTKKTAEDLSEFLKEKKVKAAYLHSDIDTLERSDVLEKLRKKEYDVLIGVNLLREGIDLPEVTLVAILDADREGFLRSRISLVQTMGRAARNIGGEVILYADVETNSIKEAIDEISRRRAYQIEYNKAHNIDPKTIYKPIREKIIVREESDVSYDIARDEVDSELLTHIDIESLTPMDKKKVVKKLETEMKRQAEDLNFEMAIKIREKVKELKDS